MINTENISGTYVLDNAHSEIGFISRHAMITKVRGNFPDFKTTLLIDDENGYTVSAVINVDTVTTGNADRDAHLLSSDFFDVENHPDIKFTASGEIETLQKEGTIEGDLTIKGVTRRVTLDVSVFGLAIDPFGNERLGFEASTTINRKDFNIDWNAPLNTGGVLVSEKIVIQIDGSGVKQ